MSEIVACDGPGCTARKNPLDDTFASPVWLTVSRCSRADQHFCSTRCAMRGLGDTSPAERVCEVAQRYVESESDVKATDQDRVKAYKRLCVALDEWDRAR